MRLLIVLMTFKRSLYLFAVFASAVSVCSPSFAEVTVLQPDADAGKDAQIGDGDVATSNHATDIDLVINWGGNNRSIGLLQFDLGAIPAAATVSSATLTLYHSANTNAGQRYDVFRTTSAWDEATVTFNTRPTFDPTAFSTLVIPDDNEDVFRTWNVTAHVEGWISGSFPNHGMWIEEVPIAGDGTAYFLSSDAAEVFRPSLAVEWIIPEPSAFAIVVTSLFALSAIRRRR
jgi:hypothetical protein